MLQRRVLGLAGNPDQPVAIATAWLNGAAALHEGR
jgi:hypothetical protein